jgi:hypothetical protein
MEPMSAVRLGKHRAISDFNRSANRLYVRCLGPAARAAIRAQVQTIFV